MSWESQYALTRLAITALARRRPAMRDSYSASLLDAAESKLNDCRISSPVGDWSYTPAPEPLFVDEPSTCNIQFRLGSTRSCSSSGDSSIRKSARTCDLVAVRFLHYRPKGMIGEYLDSVRLEIRSEFSYRSDDGEGHLF